METYISQQQQACCTEEVKLRQQKQHMVLAYKLNSLPSMAHTSPPSQEEAFPQQNAQAFLNRHQQAHLSACRLVGEVPGKPIGRAAPRA